MNYGNLTTRIKIHLAQCMKTRFARVYLKTHDVTGSEGFLRCARHFFAGILTYFKFLLVVGKEAETD